jgi:broad specificity phosphatase PhoE
MSEILFIRHAETDSMGTFCGSSDPDVNDSGMEQIAGLLAGWRGEKRFGGPVEAVFSSDLRRARTTGEALAGAFDLTCVVRPGLREIDFGAWEGLSWDEVWESHREYAERWTAEFPKLPAPGGEPYEAFRERVLAEVKELTALAHGRQIAVVTHGGVLRVILTELLNVSEAAAWERTRGYCCVVGYGLETKPRRKVERR